MTVDNDSSRAVLLSMLDQIEQLLADVRAAIVHTDDKDGKNEHE